ncbi:MAG: response regulator transcription factor [Anaerolineae bacterium]
MASADKSVVVYIEDDPDMIDLVSMILDSQRFDIKGALDGNAGLAMMRETLPDLVLLDLMLPDMAGWAVYQAMKDDQVLNQVPVIVITAQNKPIDRILGEHIAKVQVYITKPFSPAELRTAVDNVLKAAG